MIDLRSLFSKHRVPWTDVGPNTSRGNISIPCPLCRNDPSFHMAVSEDGKGWYCWRNSRHHGGSLHYLFHLLHIPTDILPQQRGASEYVEQPGLDISAWAGFDSAAFAQEPIDYLEYRGFSSPANVCAKFGLRYAPIGKWAGRLIVPLTIGWTARAIYPNIEPRYLSHTDETGIFASGRVSDVILVEGPLDALRLASLTQQYTVIATLGKRMSPALLHHLIALGTQSIHLIPDADVPSHEYLFFLRYLGSFLPHAHIRRVPIPKGYKDCCEMSEERTYEFLREFQSEPISFNPSQRMNDART